MRVGGVWISPYGERACLSLLHSSYLNIVYLNFARDRGLIFEMRGSLFADPRLHRIDLVLIVCRAVCVVTRRLSLCAVMSLHLSTSNMQEKTVPATCRPFFGLAVDQGGALAPHSRAFPGNISCFFLLLQRHGGSDVAVHMVCGVILLLWDYLIGWII